MLCYVMLGDVREGGSVCSWVARDEVVVAGWCYPTTVCIMTTLSPPDTTAAAATTCFRKGRPQILLVSLVSTRRGVAGVAGVAGMVTLQQNVWCSFSFQLLEANLPFHKILKVT